MNEPMMLKAQKDSAFDMAENNSLQKITTL